jgi:hypothetical protein
MKEAKIGNGGGGGVGRDWAEVNRILDRIALRQDKMQEQLGGVENAQGEIAEDLFRRNFQAAMGEAGVALSSVLPGSARLYHEYDIVGENGDCAVVGEVKARLRQNDVKGFLKKLPAFRDEFPQFRGKKLYGAVAGLAVRKEVEDFAKKQGLFVLTQTRQGGVAVHKPSRRPRAF